MHRVAIVGTAGRDQATMQKATPEAMEYMVQYVIDYMKKHNMAPEHTTLISGGAAVSDHVAVLLYLRGHVAKLQLYLPCAWDAERRAFYDHLLAPTTQPTPNTSTCAARPILTDNPGRRANGLHRDFAKVANMPSLEQLHTVLTDPNHANNVTSKVFDGFHARNRVIAADASHLIAFGFDKVMSTGTQMTFTLCQGQKEYVVVNVEPPSSHSVV